ncbi:MAG: acetyl-CoA hydrolase/transferase family protein [Actinobacteria bacterium]|nr:acetyl-CoA hydrolase/transferase family protein [Actinomycetota bacterium]
MPLANGEPKTVMDAIDAHGEQLRNVRVHQMHCLHDRPYLHAAYGDNLRHVSYFLSEVTRPGHAAGTVDFVPTDFSDMPLAIHRHTRDPLFIAACSPPDRHGYVSLGTNADYVARFVGRARFFLEVNPAMPRTFGENTLHLSQAIGWTVADYPLVEVPPRTPSAKDRVIAELVAERIPDGATIQSGIGAIPESILALLHEKKDLGLHSELISDGVMDLMESGAMNGTKKVTRPGKTVGTFALGTRRLYEALHDNSAVQFLPVDWVNDPRVIGREPHFASINATIEVDLLGQCNSEMIGGTYYSGSGGQTDFARGAMFSEHGQGFVVLHSTTSDERVSRVVTRLCPGAPVTTMKNTVDHVVTEYGIASLRGRTMEERARMLIAIAHHKFRDGLTADAKKLGLLR